MTKFLGESGSKKLIDLVKAKTVQDPNYVHTDNNYTNEEKTKLAGIEQKANKTVVEIEFKKYSNNPVSSNLIQKTFEKTERDRKALLDNKKIIDSGFSGDEVIVPLDEKAVDNYQLRGAFSDESEYKEDNVFGYFISNKGEGLINKTFNRIKVMVQTPGWVRIGIVRGMGSEENPDENKGLGICSGKRKTYGLTDDYPEIESHLGIDETADGGSNTLLKKWLVFQHVATPGVHTFDFPDTKIYSPYEYIYVECRAGIDGYALNVTGAAKTIQGLEVPANTQLTGTYFHQNHLSKTFFKNNGWASSNKLTSASARLSFIDSSIGRQRFFVLDSEQGEKKNLNKENSAVAGLNIGFYKRTDLSEFIMQPVSENVINISGNLENNNSESLTGLWTYDIDKQNIFFEKDLEIFAIDLFVVKPGDFTVYTLEDSDPSRTRIVDVMTLKLRSQGRQRVHLNHPIRLKFGQFLAFGGPTEAAFYQENQDLVVDSSTKKFKKGYSDNAQFAYGSLEISGSVSVGDDPTGAKNQMPYDTVVEDWSKHEFYSIISASWDSQRKTINFDNYSLNKSNSYLNIGIVARKAKISKIEGLNVSITGDSISTYRGTISKPEDFVENTNQAGANAIFYPDSGKGLVVSQDSTWWGKLIKDNRARLVRNDAWSGSTVTGIQSETSSTACSSVIRAKQLKNNRMPHQATPEGKIAHPYGTPDVIFCMIGTNDFAGNKDLGQYKTRPTEANTILGAFQTMIANHKTLYPRAKLVYFMIPRGSSYIYPAENNNGLNIAQMADAMEYAAKMMGAYFVPYNRFSALGIVQHNRGTVWTPSNGSWVHPRENIVNYTSVDYLHPNHVGHAIIANEISKFIEEEF